SRRSRRSGPRCRSAMGNASGWRRRCRARPAGRSRRRSSSIPPSSAASWRASGTSSSTARSRAASRTRGKHSGAEDLMALNLDPASIAEALRKNVETWTPSVEREEVGRVIETGDGIARVSGLPRTMANELLEFPGNLLGVAFNLDEDEIGCIIFGDASSIEEGDPVKQTGRILSVPVGDGFLGRVVDPLGQPLDEKGPIASDGNRPLEVQAPNVVSRQPVKEPLYTGITAIDAMTAIGRGQRQLIIGDRQTGKRAVALDTILNQKQYWGTEEAVRCIYVAVGQKASTVAEVVETLREHGALEYTVVVNASAKDPAPFQYIAPYAGAAIGAHW